MGIDPPSSKPTSHVSGSETSAVAQPVGTAATGLADNFQTFLSLLTTQLQNQNPLDPLNVNQFTQQLVQFSQVEQQLKSNALLKTLLETQKAMQSTQALTLVGRTAVVDGSVATLAKGAVVWNLTSPKGATATVSIRNASGQIVYSGSRLFGPGDTSFVWDGRGNEGAMQPDGRYELLVDAKDGSGQAVVMSTETQGVVDSIDLRASPILLSIGGHSYPLDKIKRVLQPASVGARA